MKLKVLFNSTYIEFEPNLTYFNNIIVRVNMKLNCLERQIPSLNVMLIYDWQILMESRENVSSSEEFSFR